MGFLFNTLNQSIGFLGRFSVNPVVKQLDAGFAGFAGPSLISSLAILFWVPSGVGLPVPFWVYWTSPYNSHYRPYT